MKKPSLPFRKLLSTILIFSMIFSLFSGAAEVVAAGIPEVTTVLYQRITENTVTGPKFTDTLTIRGMNFENPEVYIGEYSDIEIQINASLSTKSQIVIDNQEELKKMAGKLHNIKVYNNGTDLVGTAIPYDLKKIPTITSISKSKAYIGDSLDIEGLFADGFLVTATDKLFIAGTEYAFSSTDAVLNANRIHVNSAKSPNLPGLGNVTIERVVGGGGKYKIEAILKDAITVVDKLTGIAIERVDPNTGPRSKRNLVNIYGTTGQSNFNSSMRIFVNGAEGTNRGTIADSTGKVIGLSVELPTSNTAGSANILLTNSIGNSQFEIVDAFIYQDIGNTLSIDTDGITPNFKKETEDKPITIAGRNIGYFDGTNYDKLTVNKLADGSTPSYEFIKYAPYGTFTQFSNPNTYKIKYTGLYNGIPVTIIREISIFVDGEAKIKSDALTPAPTFTKSKDTMIVNPANVNLDPNEPRSVDVKVKTTTTVFQESSNTIYYVRNEEYTVKNGFKYIPDEIAPEITTVTPESGPSDKEIYMTILGKDFQVLENGTTPKVIIGDRIIEGTETVIVNGISTIVNKVRVYDDQNREVDGKKISLGTKIKIKLPAGTEMINGSVDVTVKNPSLGQFTKPNGFEFRKPNRVTEKMPKITSVVEPFADLRGGLITGETVVITGVNIDTALEGNHMVVITIDGQKAEIKGKVSADGKTVTIIPPPGTVEGPTKLQLINKDGSMTEEIFEYRRAVTAPKITRIVPIKGGKGTKLVIKGEDFLLPDGGVNPDDPKRKGTVVLLNGKELNAYNYKYNAVAKVHSITDPTEQNGATDTGIYYNGSYDPDGTGSRPAYQLDGEMIKVQDATTIYVDIPDKFYSLDAAKTTEPFLKSEDIPLGDLTVEVLNPDGAKSREKVTFTYLKPATFPAISSITPPNGSVNGGTMVTILGSNFKKDDLQVFFGSEQAKEIQYINSTELRIKVPIYPYELPQGKDKLAVPVIIMNYDGGAAVKNDGFEYRIPGSKPVITSLSPASGTAAGGEEIILRGRDFRRESDNTALPKVYFNGIEGSVRWVGNDNVSELLLVTTPPSKINGPVDITLVNYDSGSYTYKSFNYEISKPVINSAVPNSIGKQGGIKVQINGSGFKKSNLTNLTAGELVERHLGPGKPASGQIDALVMFGDALTGDKKVIDTVLGPRETLLNDIKVTCTSITQTSVTVQLAKADDPGNPFRTLAIPMDSSHLFVVNGTRDLGDAAIGDEGILIEVMPNQVVVTRRISTFAKWENNGLQITAVAPAVASIGQRKVYIQNIDGGTASYDINVLNPASNPVVSYISPRNKVKQADGRIADYVRENPTDQEYYTYTPLNGGAFITINGADFRKNVKVYMGNKELEIVSRSLNDDQLIVKVPKGTETELDKLYRIVVVNEDGASADSSALSKPHYIVYKMPQSKPLIENVYPANTASKGQNTIRIIGDDFRDGIKVYIDGVESPYVTRISYREIAVRVPLGLTPGKKLIQVMNPDYGFGEKKDAINIISSPQISEVYDAKKNNMLSPVVLSVNGGQSIRLTGRDYLDGVQVILGGILKSKEELKDGETGIRCYNIYDAEMYVVGGTAATNVKVESSGSLTFTAPKLKVGDVSIIVINKDGGVSNAINASYQKPIPDMPTGIFIEAVDSDTIKLEWYKVPDAKHYELYAAYSINGAISNSYVYAGSVEGYEVSEGLLRYYIDGLRASSWYSFKLKAVNAYGPSAFSYSSIFVRTKDQKIISYYQVPGDYEGGIAQNDRVNIVGSSLVLTVGEKSLGNYGRGLMAYFNQAGYSALNSKSVDISLNLLKKYPNNAITINEKDFALKMLSNNLLVSEAKAVSAAKLADSKMTIAVNKDLKAKGDEIKMKIPKGYKAITNPIGINVTLQVEKTKASIKGLNGTADISFSISEDMRKRYLGGMYIAYYNSITKKLELLTAQKEGVVLKAKISKPGEYMLIGKLTR